MHWRTSGDVLCVTDSCKSRGAKSEPGCCSALDDPNATADDAFGCEGNHGGGVRGCSWMASGGGGRRGHDGGRVKRWNADEGGAACGDIGNINLENGKNEECVAEKRLRVQAARARTAWRGSHAPVMPRSPENSAKARARTTAAGGGVVQGFSPQFSS
jgi:hypothetical protein